MLLPFLRDLLLEAIGFGDPTWDVPTSFLGTVMDCPRDGEVIGETLGRRKFRRKREVGKLAVVQGGVDAVKTRGTSRVEISVDGAPEGIP